MDKAYFVFDSAFWPDESYFIIRVSPTAGEWVLWVNLHKVRTTLRFRKIGLRGRYRGVDTTA